MNKQLIAAGLAATLAIPLAGTFPEAARAEASDWFVSGGLSYIEPDGSRSPDDDFTGYVGLGYWLSEKFSLEAEYNNYGFDLVDDLGEVDIDGFVVNGKYYFLGGYETSPYLGVGLGILDSDSPFANDSDSVADLLAGVQWVLGPRLGLRSELRYRFDTDDDTIPQSDGYEDWMINFGLTYAFGDRVKPTPPPPPAPEPEPEPVRAPPPPADSDGDGVLDPEDRCPGTPRGRPVDEFGCEIEVIVELDGVDFEFDSAELRSTAITTLERGLETLREYGEIRVSIEGHTDSMGPEEYNEKLSERRARAVYDWFVDQGISPTRMTWEGFGESRPVATNATPEGRAANRRVELRVVD